MHTKEHYRFSNKVLLAPLIAVLAIWTVFWVEVRFGLNFNDFGIHPRRLSGLKGVLFGPFIHGSLEHLYNNTLPLAILTGFLYYFYSRAAGKTLILGILISGVMTWLIGRPSYHIGASGVIYVLASFIFFKGILSRHFRLVALSLVVVFIYGSMIWYIFPIKDGISWEGHLSGFLSGLLLALTIRVQVPNERKFDWEKEDFDEDDDPFLKHFDEEGNFIEGNLEEPDGQGVQVNYHYKPDKKD